MTIKYKKLPNLSSNNKQIYQRIEKDGKVYITCNEDNQDYLDWVAEGNTAEEADKVEDAD
tara:strand:- start:44 stop:223 length:180 start_codon:yes stop_codon:yes gene_type:complete